MRTPADFGGENLISALDATVCPAASTGTDTSCAAAGNYAYSELDLRSGPRDHGPGAGRRLGPVPRLRSGTSSHSRTATGAGPVSSHRGLSTASDVDSTGMAVMALALVFGPSGGGRRQTGHQAGSPASRSRTAGFPGAAGDNTNSAALALMAMDLDGATYATDVDAGLSFLAGQAESRRRVHHQLRSRLASRDPICGPPPRRSAAPWGRPSAPCGPRDHSGCRRPAPPSAPDGKGYWEVAGRRRHLRLR